MVAMTRVAEQEVEIGEAGSGRYVPNPPSFRISQNGKLYSVGRGTFFQGLHASSEDSGAGIHVLCPVRGRQMSKRGSSTVCSCSVLHAGSDASI